MAQPRSGLLRSLSRWRKPIQSPAPFRTRQADQFRAESRDDDAQPALLVGQDIKQTSRALDFPVSEFHPRLRGTIRAVCLAFITRSTPIAIAAVRCETLSLFARLITLGEGVLEDAEEFVGHFRLSPEEGLQALHPFEVGNDHTAGVAKNIRDEEDFVPALVQVQVRFRAGRAVRALGQNAALNLVRILFRDHAIDRARRQDIAWHLQQFVRINPVALIEGAQVSLLLDVQLGGLNVDPLRIVKRRRCDR